MNDASSYVYVVLVDSVVRYIGKGTGRRAKRHVEIAQRNNRLRGEGKSVQATRWHNRLGKALAAGAEVEVRIIADGMDSAAAFAREITEIAASRDDLWNYTAGGEGLDSDAARRLWADPVHRDAMIAKRRTEEFRANAREKAIRQNSSPETREANRQRSAALWRDEVYRSRVAAASRSRWDDEGFKARHAEAVKKGWAENPERRKARAEITKAYAGTPEFRQRSSGRVKGMWQNPDYRARCTAQWSDPEKRAARAAKLTPEFLKRRGEAIRRGMARKKAMREGREDQSG